MPSDSKIAAPLDPAVLAERFQTLATKSQAAVQEFLSDRPDVANIGMGDPAENVAPHFAIEHCVRRVNHFVAPDLASTQRTPYDPRVSETSSWIG